jgi:hypothetical protein
VKLSLGIINEAPRREDKWGGRGIPPPFLISALDGGEWSPSRTSRFTPRKTAPCAYYMGGWVGHKTGLDVMEKRIISCSYRKSNPDCCVMLSIA